MHAGAGGLVRTATKLRSDCHCASFLTDSGKSDFSILAFYQPQLIRYFGKEVVMTLVSVFLSIISHVDPPLAAFYLLDLGVVIPAVEFCLRVINH